MERHPTDLVSLGFGVLFALTGLAFLVADPAVLPALELRWLVPSVVLVLGLWLLASALLAGRRGSPAAWDGEAGGDAEGAPPRDGTGPGAGERTGQDAR